MTADRPVFIIAEAGVNHNGDLARALDLVDAAAAAHADAVKFQTFRAEKVVNSAASKAEYQRKSDDDEELQVDLLRALELTFDEHFVLKERCEERSIEFMSTPFDTASAEFLVHQIGVDRLKVPSGEITNAPFLIRLAQFGKPILLSTGASTLNEVRAALTLLADGIAGNDMTGWTEDRIDFDAETAELLASRITVLHCTTEYPAPVEDLNLRVIPKMAEALRVPIGLSDHSLGIFAPIAAVAMGAVAIEKHFTLDRQLEGPDHAASLEPDELATMVQCIRETSSALGDGVKRPMPSEQANRNVIRRSLFAATDIPKGAHIAPENLTALRPGSGGSPMDYWRLIGKAARNEYKAGDQIDE